LDYLRDYYLPIEDVEKVLHYVPENLSESPNYIIKGSLKCFHLHVKSMLMKYRFFSPPSSLWFSSSIGIIHDFHVPQTDGEAPHLSSTDTFDLLIVSFGTIEENRALKSGMAQVIATRKERRPIWIYLPTPTLGGCPRESSPELEELIKDFTEVNLTCGAGVDSTAVRTQAQNLADNFAR
jgi:hypothetical protein